MSACVITNTVDLENFVVKNVMSNKISKRFNFVNNLVYKIKQHTEYKYTEITMHLTCVVMQVCCDASVKGDRLVETLDWLAL